MLGFHDELNQVWTNLIQNAVHAMSGRGNLRLGLHARGGKLILLCPAGFWRKGNVDITAEHYGVEQVATMDELAAAVRRRVAGWTMPETASQE